MCLLANNYYSCLCASAPLREPFSCTDLCRAKYSTILGAGSYCLYNALKEPLALDSWMVVKLKLPLVATPAES